MTIKASGPLSFSELQTEYGTTGPIKMSTYYGKTGIPASGTIKMSDFYGKSNLIWIVSGYWVTTYYCTHDYPTEPGCGLLGSWCYCSDHDKPAASYTTWVDTSHWSTP